MSEDEYGVIRELRLINIRENEVDVSVRVNIKSQQGNSIIDRTYKLQSESASVINYSWPDAEVEISAKIAGSNAWQEFNTGGFDSCLDILIEISPDGIHYYKSEGKCSSG